MSHIIHNPMLTEKSNSLTEQFNKYVFKVDIKANKFQIKYALEKRFNVKISGINYDAKYIFSDFGYNFLPSEISAAFALEQIKKLNNNILIRNKNFEYLIPKINK